MRFTSCFEVRWVSSQFRAKLRCDTKTQIVDWPLWSDLTRIAHHHRKLVATSLSAQVRACLIAPPVVSLQRLWRFFRPCLSC